jgi:hypothetical protein
LWLSPGNSDSDNLNSKSILSQNWENTYRNSAVVENILNLFQVLLNFDILIWSILDLDLIHDPVLQEVVDKWFEQSTETSSEANKPQIVNISDSDIVFGGKFSEIHHRLNEGGHHESDE